MDGGSWYVKTGVHSSAILIRLAHLFPAASLRLILLVLALWLPCRALHLDNPLNPFITISYRLPWRNEDDGERRYGKGVKDILFLAFYVLVFSFVRQAALKYVITPLAYKAGIRGRRKIERFVEQGYAFMYWTTSSVVGLVSGMK